VAYRKPCVVELVFTVAAEALIAVTEVVEPAAGLLLSSGRRLEV
jgi:hypothetical protein